MKISVELEHEEATALVTVLRRIGPSEIAMLHEGVEWPTYDKVSEKLRVALRDMIEPGWAEKTIEGLPMMDMRRKVGDREEEVWRSAGTSQEVPFNPI